MTYGRIGDRIYNNPASLIIPYYLKGKFSLKFLKASEVKNYFDYEVFILNYTNTASVVFVCTSHVIDTQFSIINPL